MFDMYIFLLEELPCEMFSTDGVYKIISTLIMRHEIWPSGYLGYAFIAQRIVRLFNSDIFIKKGHFLENV